MTPELLAEALAKAFYPVSRILRKYPDEVEDVLQTACLQAHAHRQDFQEKSKFSTWFVRIAINQAFMHIRKKKTCNRPCESIEDYVLASNRRDPEQQLLGAERRKILAGMVRSLSPKKRREILLRITEEKDTRHTGQGKTAFFHAKKQLRKMCGLPPLPDKDRRQIVDLLVEIGEPVGHGLLMPRKEFQREKQLD